MSCGHDHIEPRDYGVDFKAMCDSHASDLIHAIADAKGFPVRLIRPETLWEKCHATIVGISPEYRTQLIAQTLRELDWLADYDADDAVTMQETLQNVASRNRYPTAD